MAAQTEDRHPLLSVTFRESCINIAVPHIRELQLFPGDVLDLDAFGDLAGMVLDTITGRHQGNGPALRYLDMPKEAWPFEDLAKFQVCFRPRAIHLCDGDGSRHADNWPGCVDCGAPMTHQRALDHGGSDMPLAALSRMLQGVSRDCRVLVIDPLTQFVADQHIAAAHALLQEHALLASRVVVFRCRLDRMIH